jgi:hypothetical protein
MPRQALQEHLHQQILELLFENVRADTYPSVAMLDLIEQRLRDDDDIEEYADLLMQKVAGDTYPSHDLLTRLLRFA